MRVNGVAHATVFWVEKPGDGERVRQRGCLTGVSRRTLLARCRSYRIAGDTARRGGGAGHLPCDTAEKDRT